MFDFTRNGCGIGIGMIGNEMWDGMGISGPR